MNATRLKVLLFLLVCTPSMVASSRFVQIGKLFHPCTFKFSDDQYRSYVLSIVTFNGTIVYARDMLSRDEIKDRVDFFADSMHIKSLDKDMLGQYSITLISTVDRSKSFQIDVIVGAVEDSKFVVNDSDHLYETRIINDSEVWDRRHRQPSCKAVIHSTPETHEDVSRSLKFVWKLENDSLTSSSTYIFDNATNSIELESVVEHAWIRADHSRKLRCQLVQSSSGSEYVVLSGSTIVKIKYGPELMLGEDDVTVIRNYSGQPMLLKCGIIGHPEPLITWSRTDDDIDVSRRIIGTGKFYKFRRSTPGVFNISCHGEANGQATEQKFTIHLTANVRSLTEGEMGLGKVTSIVAGSVIGAFIVTLIAALLMCLYRRRSRLNYVDRFLDRHGGSLPKLVWPGVFRRKPSLFRFNKRHYAAPSSLTHKNLISNSPSVVGLSGHVDFVDPLPLRNGGFHFTRPGSAGPCLISKSTDRSTIICIDHSHENVIQNGFHINIPSPPPYSSLGNLCQRDKNFNALNGSGFRNAPGSRLPLRLPSISATDPTTMQGLSRLTMSGGTGTYIEDKPTNV